MFIYLLKAKENWETPKIMGVYTSLEDVEQQFDYFINKQIEIYEKDGDYFWGEVFIQKCPLNQKMKSNWQNCKIKKEDLDFLFYLPFKKQKLDSTNICL